jgi:P4 family phage/plasmid primase-like protien
MEDLNNFLGIHRVKDKNVKATHIRVNPSGKFHISKGKDLIEFYNYYNICLKNKEILCFLETQDTIEIPVIIDIDLKVKNEGHDGDKLYTLEQVKIIVNIYQNILKLVLNNCNDSDLICFLLEKPAYIEKGMYKNGFHLHFPKIFVSRSDQEKIILPMIKKELEAVKDLLPTDELIDENILRGKGTPWCLYGSSKGYNYKPYSITMGYNSLGEEESDWISLLKDYPIYNKVNNDSKYLEEHLPEIFSLQCSDENKKTDFFYKIKSIYKEKMEIEIKKEVKKNYVYEDKQDFNQRDDNFIDNLLDALPEIYYNEFNKWMYIGWILFNIYNGSEHGLEKWDSFSMQSENKYDANRCRYEWEKMEKKNLTLGSLKFFVQKSNPVKYLDIMKEYASSYYEKALECDEISHNDIAKLLHIQYENKYVCASVSKNIWYEFEGHTWKELDDGFSLRNKISTEIVKEYENQYENIELKGNTDKNAIMEVNKKIKSIQKIVLALKSSPFKKNVMTEAKDIFYNPYFLSKLDSNPSLFGFKNGVYDLENLYFRDGLPSDYISLSSPVNYRDDFTPNDPEMLLVNDFFYKIFPNKAIRDYFLTMNAFIFVGGNLHKKVQIWTGVGDNGKSVTQAFFEKLLGPLCVKLPTSLITGKRTQSSSASPELVRAGSGVRYAFLQEPSKTDILNTGILKELSGNDTFYARGLFKNGSDITPMFKLALICNDPPKMEETDQAAWNRLRVIPFESCFCTDAPNTLEEQIKLKRFQIDRQFDKKIPSMLEAFVFQLIEIYKIKKNDKNVFEPEEVLLATQEYRNKNDYFGKFVDECLMFEEGESIDGIELYDCFKGWIQQNNPGTKIPPRQELDDYLRKRIGRMEKKRWKNYTIIEDSFDFDN